MATGDKGGVVGRRRRQPARVPRPEKQATIWGAQNLLHPDLVNRPRTTPKPAPRGLFPGETRPRSVVRINVPSSAPATGRQAVRHENNQYKAALAAAVPGTKVKINGKRQDARTYLAKTMTPQRKREYNDALDRVMTTKQYTPPSLLDQILNKPTQRLHQARTGARVAGVIGQSLAQGPIDYLGRELGPTINAARPFHSERSNALAPATPPAWTKPVVAGADIAYEGTKQWYGKSAVNLLTTGHTSDPLGAGVEGALTVIPGFHMVGKAGEEVGRALLAARMSGLPKRQVLAAARDAVSRGFDLPDLHIEGGVTSVLQSRARTDAHDAIDRLMMGDPAAAQAMKDGVDKLASVHTKGLTGRAARNAAREAYTQYTSEAKQAIEALPSVELGHPTVSTAKQAIEPLNAEHEQLMKAHSEARQALADAKLKAGDKTSGPEHKAVLEAQRKVEEASNAELYTRIEHYEQPTVDPSNPLYAEREAMAKKLINDYTGREGALPPKMTSTDETHRVLDLLTKMALKGARGRQWYLNSAHDVLAMTHNDLKQAEKLTQLIAIYSPQQQVLNNTALAFRAYTDWLNDAPISVGQTWQKDAAQGVLDGTHGWDGRKTNNFYRNIMADVVKLKTGEDETARTALMRKYDITGHEITNDMWMARGVGYPTKAVSDGRYDVLDTVVGKVAKELGWEPREVQAAVWTYIKDVSDDTSANIDFADAIARQQAHIFAPVGVVPEVADAINRFTEETGLMAGSVGPGGRQVKIGTGTAPRPEAGIKHGSTTLYNLPDNEVRMLNATTAAIGRALGRDSMQWVRPFKALAASHVSMIVVRLDRAGTDGEARALLRELEKSSRKIEVMPSETGLVIRNSDLKLPNAVTKGGEVDFSKLSTRAVARVFPDQTPRMIGYASDARTIKEGSYGRHIERGAGFRRRSPERLRFDAAADRLAGDIEAASGRNARTTERAGPAGAASFDRALARTKEGEYGAFLSDTTAADLTAKGHRLFVGGPNGEIHYAISPDGDFGYFASNLPGEGRAALQQAIQQGARTLDAYDGFLPKYYEGSGFREVARNPWDDALAPANWDYEKFGRPDIVHMAYRPDAPIRKSGRRIKSWDRGKEIAASRAERPLAGEGSERLFFHHAPESDPHTRYEPPMQAAPKTVEQQITELGAAHEPAPAPEGVLFHGSPEGKLDNIDALYHTKPWREGPGFYLTSDKRKAAKYARGKTAKAGRKTGKGAVNAFRLHPDANVLNLDEQPVEFWRQMASDIVGEPITEDKWNEWAADIPTGSMSEGIANRERLMNLLTGYDEMPRTDAYYAIEEALHNQGVQATLHHENGAPVHVVKDATILEHAPEHVPTPDEVWGTPGERMHSAMRGAGGEKGAARQVAEQEAARRPAREEKAANLEEALQNKDLTPVEARAAASEAMRGPLPAGEFRNFRHLSTDDVRAIQDEIRFSPALLPYERINGLDAFEEAVGGRVPTTYEQGILEKVFGPDWTNALVEHATDPWWRAAPGELWNAPRLVRSSLDLSGGFRQALMVAPRHPRVFFRHFIRTQLRAVRSKEGAENEMARIRAMPTYELMMEAKVPFTDMSGSMGHQEEAFMSRFLGRVPGISHSGRAYTALLNGIRADLFNMYLDIAEQNRSGVFGWLGGKRISGSVESLSQDERKDLLESLGRLVGSMTGRGTMVKDLEKGAELANRVLFSPRLLAARMNFLSPVYYTKLHPVARRIALRNMGQFLAAIGITLGLAKLAGASINTNPTNADFLKIRFGNTRIDVLGGFAQPVRLLSEIFSNRVTSSTTGKSIRLSGGYGKMSQEKIILRFLRSKANPSASAIWNQAAHEDFLGNPLTWQGELQSLFLPMLLQDVSQTFHQHGGKAGDPGSYSHALPVTGLSMLLSGVGFGVQSYGAKKKKKYPLLPVVPSSGGGGGAGGWGGSSGGGW